MFLHVLTVLNEVESVKNCSGDRHLYQMHSLLCRPRVGALDQAITYFFFSRLHKSCVIWLTLVSVLTILSLIARTIPVGTLVDRPERTKDWNVFKAFSTVGQFLQVGFTTMTSLSMTPFMCYRHPTEQDCC